MSDRPYTIAKAMTQEVPPQALHHQHGIRRRLWIMLLLAGIAIALFLSYNLSGNINYILTRRLHIVGTMVLVAFAASISTVLFQTITNNRILAPSVMGFEALFILLQTSLIFLLGSSFIATLDPVTKFGAETALMILFSALLYRWIFNGDRQDLHFLLLVGIICASMFYSLSGLMQRLLAPSEFAILQSRIFASFTMTPQILLIISTIILTLVGVLIWRYRFSFDVLALGRNSAIGLGINYGRAVTCILLLVSLLVSISTALVGPLTFFGFMVANLAYVLVKSHQHRYILPAAFLLGVISLVGGQFVWQHLLGMAGTLSVVIEFVGGTLFIIMLLRKAAL